MTTILVTGGSGCIGQHIIKHFEENVENIDEIRVLDLQKFEQKLEYKCKIPIVGFIGSITDKHILDEATRGVHSVIHTAAYVDVKLFPDTERLDLVNRQGTELLLEACCKNNVEIFIHCSSIDVIQGFENIANGNEDNIKPDKLLFGGYARSKRAGENAVLKMNGRQLPNGSTMRTVALRPMVVYGELDVHFVPVAIEAGVKNRGIMIDFCGSGSCTGQYAGNVAWAFVCAHKAMTSDNELGGEAFIVKDDTPYNSMIRFCKPYFDIFDVTIYRSFIPFWILYFILQFIEVILIMISPLKKIQFPFTLSTLIFTNLKTSFDGSKAENMLKYKPLYSPEESCKRSTVYYKSLDFERKKNK